MPQQSQRCPPPHVCTVLPLAHYLAGHLAARLLAVGAVRRFAAFIATGLVSRVHRCELATAAHPLTAPHAWFIRRLGTGYVPTSCSLLAHSESSSSTFTNPESNPPKCPGPCIDTYFRYYYLPPPLLAETPGAPAGQAVPPPGFQVFATRVQARSSSLVSFFLFSLTPLPPSLPP
jgi:hypothetical protein